MDVLADALRVSGARGALGFMLEAGESWGLWLDSHQGASLHVVARGTLWLHVAGERPVRIGAGDAVLLSPGTAHGMASGPDVRMGACDVESAARARAEGSVFRLGPPPVR
ncbi:cupin domain-containing protein, partial [Streptomyces corynorhini]